MKKAVFAVMLTLMTGFAYTQTKFSIPLVHDSLK